MSDSSFEQYLEQFVADVEARSTIHKIGVLYYADDAMMDSPRRRKMAKILNEHEQKLADSTAAYALATSSAFVRGVLSTLFWLAPPGYPNKVVGTPLDGLRFIAEHVRGIEPQTVGASFMRLLDSQQLRKAS